MYGNQPTERRQRSRKLLGAIGLLAAGAVVGGIMSANLTASANDNDPSTNSTSAAKPEGHRGPGDGHGGRSTAVRPGETALTGSQAEKVRAAALKAVPGGTVYRVETDADGAAYEAHMTKADGSLVTAKLDENFTVTSVEDGMGAGAPAPNTSDDSGSGT